MKKGQVIFGILYYALVSALFYLSLYAFSSALEVTKGKENIGFVIVFTYGFLFVFTPVFIAVLMRFSPLKWPIDPFAALEIPLFLYAAMILQNMKRSGSGLLSSFRIVHNELNDDGGMGWIFLIGIFLFGVVCSISFSRPKGNSVFYKLTDKIGDHKKGKDTVQ